MFSSSCLSVAESESWTMRLPLAGEGGASGDISMNSSSGSGEYMATPTATPDIPLTTILTNTSISPSKEWVWPRRESQVGGVLVMD